MIQIKEKIKELRSIPAEDLYILTDFDGTITSDYSDSTWACIFKNPNVTDKFVQECISVFNKYHTYEINDTIPYEEKVAIMDEWYNKNIGTLIKYGITEQIINYSADNEKILSLREGVKDFLKEMNDKSIPIIIISAGVGNIIKQLLNKNECEFQNIHICSNFLEYMDGVVNGVKNSEHIHPLNKNEVLLPDNVKKIIEKRNNIILFGNSESDINMADNSKNIYRIGFLNEKRKKGYLNSKINMI